MAEMNERDWLEWICRYVDGNLDPESASKLLECLRQDESLQNILTENVLCDIFLSERAHLDQSIQVTQFIEEFQWKDCSDLIALEKTVKPIVRSESRNDTSNPALGKSGSELDTERAPSYTKSSASEKSGKKSRKKSQIPFIIRLCCFFVVMIWLSMTGKTSKFPVDRYDEFDYIARVSETVNAVWGDGQGPYKRGEMINAEKLVLNSGLVKLHFKDGAEVILDGPSELVLNNLKDTFCNYGKLSISIPKTAIGFQIGTPFGTFIDRGTEFALQVGPKEAKMDVVKGKVDVSWSRENKLLSLTKGGSTCLALGTIPQRTRFTDTPYISKEQFDILLTEDTEKKIREEEQSTETLYSYPGLVAHFDFRKKDEKQVANSSRTGKDKTSQAIVHSSHFDEGRWNLTSSVRFSGMNDSIQFDHRGNYDHLTLVTSVRLDSLRKNGNVLYADRNFGKETGTFLWQILDDGSMQFQFQGEETLKQADQLPVKKPKMEYCTTRSVFTKKKLGTWTTLCLVVNGTKKTISQYVDGRLVSVKPCPELIRLKVSGAVLGNSFNGEKGVTSRYFNGAMDMFSLYDRPLTSQEIKAFSKVE